MKPHPSVSPEHLLADLCDRHPADAERLRRAAETAQAHGERPGQPGGLVVAGILDDLGADGDTLVAGLLSAPTPGMEIDTGELVPIYGERVARLVRNARWLNAFREDDDGLRSNEPAERLRRMILALAEDVRAVLIRLAYRTARMRQLADEPAATRERVARETLDLYAPLANRLGVHRLKWELEDLAFRFLDPDRYRSIAIGLAERREDRERFVEQFTADLRRALAEDGLRSASVFGRPKHIYSIWRKMQRKHVEFDQVFDIHAVRVLVDRVQDCYLALGTVHGCWTHVPQEFDDYIANPKENGYQSLHTAVMGPWGRPVEVQIRTHEMNEHAERGVAAHWLYKEGSGEAARLQDSINALRSLLESGGDDGLGEAFQRELLDDRVFVFTPRGDVIDLPQGATVLDFAFHIHTDVGYRCRGAKVNGRIVPLNQVLANGDSVEVLTTREARPGRDWLNRDLGYLRTSRARAKVRAWFNQRDRQQHIEDGRQLLERELRRLNARSIPLGDLLREVGHARAEELYVALGRNEIGGQRIAAAVQSLTRAVGKQEVQAETVQPTTDQQTADVRSPDAVHIDGVGNLLTRMASCCKPVPGDDVIGYITRGRGVTVHRRDCHNVLRLTDGDRDRLIEVDWGAGVGGRWQVDISVDAFDRSGLLRDITQVLTEKGVHIADAGIDATDDAPRVRVRLTIQVQDMAELNQVLQRIDQLPNVLEAVRSG